MWKVDIYLETDSTFQGKRERKCGYVLSTMVGNEEKTKENFGISNGTYHQSVLMALIEALSRMNVSSEICVHTQDSYVASRLLKLEEMAGEGWRDSKGELIKNAAEWEQVYRLIHAFPEAHKMTARFEKHSYSTWLQEMMKKNECGRIMGQGLESATRAESNDNGVSNPDDPSLDVYKEYINCSRPLPEWEDGTPQEIKDELKEEPKPGWVHWFFSFDDNAGLPEEKKQRIIQNTPKGTKIWKNKIEGLRGKATGLVFPNFLRKKHVVSEEWVRSQMAAGKIRFKKFTCGLDTSYSSKSPDTIAMMFQGITEDRKLITLAEKVYSNKDLDQPLAPSDTTVKFIEFLERCRKDWGFAKDTFVDCADAATITELRKYKRLHSCLYNFVESYKKVTILDRIKLQLGWIQQDCYLVLDTC